MSGVDVWTERLVLVTPLPKHNGDAWERAFDALPEHYWDNWREKLMWQTLCISAHSGVMEIGGWRWFVPGWLARRSVASVVARAGLDADVEFKTIRAVMTKPTPDLPASAEETGA